jgi:transglutaminase-like putative cysteine protease
VLRSLSIAWLVCSILTAASLRAEDAILHEYVPAIDPDEVDRALSKGVASAPTPGSESSSDAGVTSGPSSVAAPAENFRPDRLTSLEGGLDYFEAFTPAIAPFKRMMALDAVRLDVDGTTPVLGVRDVRHRPVPLENADRGAPDPRPRDRFVGELDLDFAGESSVRLPSVSPESRILELQTTPVIAVRVERDGADNFYLRALGKIPEQPVHVRFLSDAPRAYFGGSVPRLPLRELANRPKLEPSIARRALRFANQLELSPRSDLRTALDTLTRYFRDFAESSSPPDNTGDLFLDLARGRKGVCRHRAYAFVVTAQALGMNARFVQNEAHSWVEVELPTSGFLRIDLGGASHGLTAHNAQDRPNYLPAQPDTLPRPPAYRQSYAQAAAATPPPTAAKTNPDEYAGRWLRDDGPAAAGPLNRTRTDTTSKRPLRVELDDRRIDAVRGGQLVLTGRIVEAPERGVPDLRVEVWIARAEPNERMLLAVQVTDASGYFRAAFGVPPDLAVGDYQLIVLSQGDDEHLPVSAN